MSLFRRFVVLAVYCWLMASSGALSASILLVGVAYEPFEQKNDLKDVVTFMDMVSQEASADWNFLPPGAPKPPPEDSKFKKARADDGLVGGISSIPSSFGAGTFLHSFSLQIVVELSPTGWRYFDELIRFPNPPIDEVIKIPIGSLT